MARRPRLVTLTTDLGSAYAAQMKAVLYRSVPPGHVVDITHDLVAHRIPEAAFLLERIAPGFPSGTVHVAVVDPGVGGARAGVAVRCSDGTLLVGPDNGLLWPVAQRLGVDAAVRIDPTRLVHGQSPSATFEGRDVFAPAAAHLALGRKLERLGSRVRLTPMPLAAAARRRGQVEGEVVHVDRFGNAITNVPSDWVPEGAVVQVSWGRRRRTLSRVRTYSDLEAGGGGLIGSSFGTLELSWREDSAARRLLLQVGDAVAFHPTARRSGRGSHIRGPTRSAGKTVNIARRR
jgi:S-adenosylmethionine hydrolase